MKVLLLCNKIPYPEKDGGVIAINSITQGLLDAGCDVKMLAMNTQKHFINVYDIPEKYRNERHLEAVPMDTRIKPMNALLALLSGKSYNISRFNSEAYSGKLAEILQKEKFDVIHLEGLYLTPYIDVVRKHTNAPIILRTHNIEWKIWQKLAREEKRIVKKWYLSALSNQLKKYEEEYVKKVDGIATITNLDMEDLKSSGCKVPLVNIPFGIDVTKYVPSECKYPNSLFYIGALDWLPNLQGLDWFLKNCWNAILEKFPEVQFHIAGRNMPDSLRNGNYKGVVLHGEVEDARNFMQQYDIMLVPLLAGSGVRIKILEGMALQKPIVTTGMGIEGIECVYERDILVEDEPSKFMEAVNKVLSDTVFKQSLAERARKFVEGNYDRIKSTDKLLEFYKERISQRK